MQRVQRRMVEVLGYSYDKKLSYEDTCGLLKAIPLPAPYVTSTVIFHMKTNVESVKFGLDSRPIPGRREYRFTLDLQGRNGETALININILDPWWNKASLAKVPALPVPVPTPPPQSGMTPWMAAAQSANLMRRIDDIVTDGAKNHHPVQHTLSRLDALCATVPLPGCTYQRATLSPLTKSGQKDDLYFSCLYLDNATGAQRNFSIEAAGVWWEGAYKTWMHLYPKADTLVSADAVDFHRMVRDEIERCRTDGEDRANTRLRLRKVVEPYIATGKYELEWCNVERDPTPNACPFKATLGITATTKSDEDGDTPLMVINVPINDPWW